MHQRRILRCWFRVGAHLYGVQLDICPSILCIRSCSVVVPGMITASVGFDTMHTESPQDSTLQSGASTHWLP